jgi:alkylated DNA repair dioxygenase AlkB
VWPPPFSYPAEADARRKPAALDARRTRSTHMPVTVLRDIAGIPGLHVALDVFTEETERRLFKSPIHGRASEEDYHRGGQRNGQAHGPILHDDAYRLCNAVRDCGLFPGFITPDSCLSWSYPGPSAQSGGASFALHFDSRYSIGETVVGVNLGQGCVMEFQPGDEWWKAHPGEGPPAQPPQDAAAGVHVEVRTFDSGSFKLCVAMPRRSIYVMSGLCRWQWKHGIAKLSSKNLAPFAPPPSWNAYGMRRSLTLRAGKAFSDATLHRLLQRAPNDASLKAYARRGTRTRRRSMRSHEPRATPLPCEHNSARDCARQCSALPCHVRRACERAARGLRDRAPTNCGCV